MLYWSRHTKTGIQKDWMTTSPRPHVLSTLSRYSMGENSDWGLNTAAKHYLTDALVGCHSCSWQDHLTLTFGGRSQPWRNVSCLKRRFKRRSNRNGMSKYILMTKPPQSPTVVLESVCRLSVKQNTPDSTNRHWWLFSSVLRDQIHAAGRAQMYRQRVEKRDTAWVPVVIQTWPGNGLNSWGLSLPSRGSFLEDRKKTETKLINYSLKN